jgi:hypothetical protein
MGAIRPFLQSQSRERLGSFRKTISSFPSEGNAALRRVNLDLGRFVSYHFDLLHVLVPPAWSNAFACMPSAFPSRAARCKGLDEVF